MLCYDCHCHCHGHCHISHIEKNNELDGSTILLKMSNRKWYVSMYFEVQCTLFMFMAIICIVYIYTRLNNPCTLSWSYRFWSISQLR